MKKILYINPIHTPIECLSYVDNIAHKKEINIPFFWFAEEFPKTFLHIFQEKNYDEIWVINGPWAFTQMRIISLTVNALKFSSPNLTLKSTSYFDICRSNGEVISIIDANTNEYLISRFPSEEIFIKKSEKISGKFHGFLKNPETFEADFRLFTSDFSEIFPIFEKISPQEYISPLYIKPPHITWTPQK